MLRDEGDQRGEQLGHGGEDSEQRTDCERPTKDTLEAAFIRLGELALAAPRDDELVTVQ
jgi:hypothetical protein